MSPRYYLYLFVLMYFTVFGIVRWKRLQSRYQYLVLLVFTVFLSEIASRFLAHSISTTHPAYHILIPVMALLFGSIYRNALTKNYIFLAGILISISCFLLTIFIQPLIVFPSLAFILLALFVITICLFDFAKMLRNPINEKLTQIPAFWMNLGNLTFYSITFFVFGLNNIGIDILPNWIYDLIFFANIMLYSAFGWTLVLAARKK